MFRSVDPYAVNLTMNVIQAKRHRDFVQHASVALVLLVEARSVDSHNQIKSPYYTAEEERRMFLFSSDEIKYRRFSMPRHRTIISETHNREHAKYWTDLLQPATADGNIDEVMARQVNSFHSFPPPTCNVYLFFTDLLKATKSR